MILAHERNALAQRVLRELRRRLPDGWAPPDLRVVIGGDGFLLHTVAEHGFEPLYLGLNAGHLGFLLNDLQGREAHHWDALAALLQAGGWREHRFPVLRAAIEHVDGRLVEAHAINDVYLERSSGQTANLSLDIDGTCVERRLVSDGLILATALGSTAYSFSAGGPAVHPTLQLVMVTPICPHSPRLAPFAVPSTARITVEVGSPEKRPVRAVADGRAIEGVRRVVVSIAAHTVRLAYLDHHDFTRQMVRKIVHP